MVKAKRRELIVNWGEEHFGLRADLEEEITDPLDLREVGPGWTYVTHFALGTHPGDVLFNLSDLEQEASDSGFFIPGELVAEHNKIVVTATTAMPDPA